jgi:hypothetical protein
MLEIIIIIIIIIVDQIFVIPVDVFLFRQLIIVNVLLIVMVQTVKTPLVVNNLKYKIKFTNVFL